MKEIHSIQRFGDGYLAKGLSDTGIKRSIELMDIRGAVVPPRDNNPGYYLYMGMLKNINEHMKYPLMYLSDGTDRLPSALMDAVFDDASRLKASSVYAEMPKDRRAVQGFYRDIWKKRSNEGLPVRIRPAISATDLDYGRALIEEWTTDRALIRPYATETIYTEQLRSMDLESDIKDSRWYVFHALRYLLAGYIKDPPLPVMQKTSTGWGDKYDSENIISQQGNSERSLSGWL